MSFLFISFIIVIVIIIIVIIIFFWLSNIFYMKQLRLIDCFVCLHLFLELKLWVIIHNFITLLPFPKHLQFSSFISILTFYIAFLPLVLSWICFNRFSGSYQWAKCLCSTLAGLFSWWSSFTVKIAGNRLQGAWRRSALCDVPVFIFM